MSPMFLATLAVEPSIFDMADAVAKLPRGRRTPFALAMPEEFKCGDAVTSYRAYYKSKPFAKWEYSKQPRWWS